MKKFYFLAAAALTLMAVSCNKELAPEQEQAQEKVEMTFALSSPVTKASASDIGTVSSGEAQGASESKVNEWQLWVFNADGTFDAYKSVTGGSKTTTLAVTAGSKHCWAIVNGADIAAASIQTESALKAIVAGLDDNAFDSFIMSGEKDVTMPAAGTVTIDVQRLVSRIVIRKITNSLTTGQDMTIKAIEITNVAGDVQLDAKTHAAGYNVSAWFNKEGTYDPSSPNAFADPAKFCKDVPAASLANGASYSTAHFFYGCPNDYAEVDGGAWSARGSKLVIVVTVAGQDYYYPIALPDLERNKSYEVTELVLTRLGNPDDGGDDTGEEDTPISTEDANFEIDVVDWTVVDLGNSGVITI